MFSTVTNFCCKSWGGFQNVLSVFLSFTLVAFLSLGFSFFVIRELLVVKTVMCLSRAGHLLEASSVFVGLVGGRGREGGAPNWNLHMSRGILIDMFSHFW